MIDIFQHLQSCFRIFILSLCLVLLLSFIEFSLVSYTSQFYSFVYCSRQKRQKAIRKIHKYWLHGDSQRFQEPGDRAPRKYTYGPHGTLPEKGSRRSKIRALGVQGVGAGRTPGPPKERPPPFFGLDPHLSTAAGHFLVISAPRCNDTQQLKKQ